PSLLTPLPTRRSSDLSSAAPERDNSANFWPPRNRSYEAVIDPCTAYFSGRSVPKLKNGGLFRVAVVASEMDGRMNTENALRRAQDRKSTRLNSSHVSI